MTDLSAKSEKLASALYFLTSFFNDQEPLKWKLRTFSSELIIMSISLAEGFSREREVKLLETKKLVNEITALLAVARNSGLISSENNTLIQGEFSKFSEMFEIEPKLKSILTARESLGVLKIPEHVPIIKDKIEENMSENKGHISDTDESREKSLKAFGVVSVKKNSRQSVIISILKRKKEIMIKDVSSLINGCSEKTIQRELSSMVQKGVLKKMGDKRWSRYSLA